MKNLLCTGKVPWMLKVVFETTDANKKNAVKYISSSTFLVIYFIHILTVCFVGS